MLIVPQQREAEAKAEMFCPQPPRVSLGRQHATPRCPEKLTSLVSTKRGKKDVSIWYSNEKKKKNGDSNPLKNKLSPPKRL